jgi:hypothetical protein
MSGISAHLPRCRKPWLPRATHLDVETCTLHTRSRTPRSRQCLKCSCPWACPLARAQQLGNHAWAPSLQHQVRPVLYVLVVHPTHMSQQCVRPRNATRMPQCPQCLPRAQSQRESATTAHLRTRFPQAFGDPPSMGPAACYTSPSRLCRHPHCLELRTCGHRNTYVTPEPCILSCCPQ